MHERLMTRDAAHELFELAALLGQFIEGNEDWPESIAQERFEVIQVKLDTVCPGLVDEDWWQELNHKATMHETACYALGVVRQRHWPEDQ